MSILRDVLLVGFTGITAAAATVTASSLDYFNKDRELDIKMINIAFGILREDPSKSGVTAARGWAVDVISQSSGIPIPDAAKKELERQKLPIQEGIVSAIGLANSTEIGRMRVRRLLDRIDQLEDVQLQGKKEPEPKVEPVEPKK